MVVKPSTYSDRRHYGACPREVLCPGPRPVQGKSSASPLPPADPCVTLCGVAQPDLPDDVKTGDLLWTPSAERVEQAGITAFTRWLADTRGLTFAGYADLWQWSITDTDAFWQAIWDYNGIQSATRPTAVLGHREMPGAQWFPGAALNYAEH